MSGFIEGENRHQSVLFPESLDEYIGDDSAVRVIDVFIDDLDISGLGFKTEPAETGRPGYHPRTMLKLYVYGYLNRVQSSRRLEREAQRNVELMWLTGRLAPDFKTIANFRKDNGKAIRLVCGAFVTLCRKLDLFKDAVVAIDGSKFKEVIGTDHLRVVADRGYFKGEEILACDEASITTYLPRPQTSGNVKKGMFSKRDFIYHADDDEYECPDGERLEWRFEAEEKEPTIHKYWTSACTHCSIKSLCTSSDYRRITRWEYEEVIEELEARLDHDPERMRARRETVEHPFGTIKSWLGYTHFQMKTLPRVSTEMSLHVLAYNMKRLINLLGVEGLLVKIQTA